MASIHLNIHDIHHGIHLNNIHHGVHLKNYHHCINLNIDHAINLKCEYSVVVSKDAPLPLFLGRLNEGIYLVKIQFQAAVIDGRILNSSIAPWQTVDKMINLEITAEGGSRQSQILEITDNSDKIGVQIRKKSDSDSAKIDSQSMEKL